MQHPSQLHQRCTVVDIRPANAKQSISASKGELAGRTRLALRGTGKSVTRSREEPEGRVVHQLSRPASQDRRGKGRHSSSSSHLRQRRRPHPPEAGASVLMRRSAARALPALSAPPPAVRCGGGPSPAPWQPSCAHDGATPGAGVPGTARQRH